MENSTLPFWLTDHDHFPRKPFMELRFFKYLKRNNIPCGIFYRDMYWMFDDEYPLQGYKRKIMRSIYKLEYKLYKTYFSNFFLPSMEMNDYIKFPERKTSSLPPGGENLLDYSKDNHTGLNIIYVGGISVRYGLLKMLEAINQVYEKNRNVKLHLVCRKEEYVQNEEIFNKFKDNEWLTVYHANGEKLKEIYKKADLGIIPIEKNTYNDFAVPVKLFEYISYGLPIIATNCNAQTKIINEDNLGLITEDSSEDIARKIQLLMDEELRSKLKENVSKTLLSKHLWLHRAEMIYYELLGEYKL
jgi:glycosyltransferase involved in cell wall biosynthesis